MNAEADLKRDYRDTAGYWEQRRKGEKEWRAIKWQIGTRSKEDTEAALNNSWVWERVGGCVGAVYGRWVQQNGRRSAGHELGVKWTGPSENPRIQSLRDGS